MQRYCTDGICMFNVLKSWSFVLTDKTKKTESVIEEFFVIHFFIAPIRWNLRVEHTIEFVLTPLLLSVIKSALYSFRHTLLLLSYCIDIDIVVFSRRILPTISTMVTNRGLFVKKRNSFDQAKLSFGSIRVQKNTFNILTITGINVLYVLLQNEVILNFYYRCSSWMYFM